MGQICNRLCRPLDTDSDSDTDSQRASHFLQGLPPNTQHHYPYRSDRDLATKTRALREELINETSFQQYLVFEDAPPDSVYPLIKQDPTIPRACYDASLELLVVRIDSLVQWQALNATLSELIATRVREMGLDGSLIPVGHAPHIFDSVIKEADCAWEARTVHGNNRSTGNDDGTTSTLTLVGEFGFPESASRLDVDARRWIEENGSSIQMAFYATVNARKPEVRIVVYERTAQTRTWHANAGQPRRVSSAPATVRQMVHVVRQDGKTVVSDELVLPFDKVFLRAANPGTLEEDIVLSKEDLGVSVERVWKLMGFSLEI